MNCTICKTETALFVAGEPVCVACDEERTTVRNVLTWVVVLGAFYLFMQLFRRFN